jgi:tetratricopeptide (TPR) repeat protein
VSPSALTRALVCVVLVLSVHAVGLAGSRSGWASARPVPPQGGTRIAKLESAAEQLRAAGGLKQQMRGTHGLQREGLRDRAIDAYRAVRRYWVRDREACAEAAFRAGELLRAADRHAEALTEFRAACAAATRSGFASRAALEIGHIHRRRGRHAAALDVYLDLVADPAAAAPQRDEAMLWAGRVYALEDRLEDAQRLWVRLSRTARDPVDRVAAFDEWALSVIDSGDLEAAAGVLERCREACADVLLEETQQGRRVRQAISRMSSVGRLERAIAARRRGVVIDSGR